MPKDKSGPLGEHYNSLAKDDNFYADHVQEYRTEEETLISFHWLGSSCSMLFWFLFMYCKGCHVCNCCELV